MCAMQRNKTIDTEIAHGEKISECAERTWGWSTNVGKKRLEKRARKIVSSIKDLHSNKILEIGCGTGALTKFFMVRQNVIGIDASFYLLKRAMKKTYISKVNFAAANALKLPFGDKSFSAVAGNSVMHHLVLRELLPEIFRVLEPGGKISFAEPNMLNPQIMFQKNLPFLKQIAGDVPHETAFLRWSLENVLKRYRFCNVCITPFDFLHPATPVSWITFVQYVSDYLERAPLFREIAGSLHIYGEKA